MVTNAVIERRGAVTRMLVTEGFSDMLDIAMKRRYDIYDLRLRFPAPIVPLAMRAEIVERIAGRRQRRNGTRSCHGGRTRRRAARTPRHRRARHLHAFTNPIHDEQTRRAVAAVFPDLYLSSSADVFPFMREYERWNTTAINAYVQPLVDRYLQRIEESLTKEGFRGQLHLMTSTGGTVSVATARRYPVRMLESGPAAGVLMSAYLGRLLDLPNVLAFDMGGTTAKGSVIRDGLPRKRYDIEIARVHEFRVGGGLPMKIPVIDMIEIGAGGGSIARIDGSVRPVELSAPEGCILHAQRPAATGAQMGVDHFVMPLIFGALTPVIPDKTPADPGMINSLTVLGRDRNHAPFSTLFFSAGGLGALAGQDGNSATPAPADIMTMPAETWETLTGMRVLARWLRPDCRLLGMPGGLCAYMNRHRRRRHQPTKKRAESSPIETKCDALIRRMVARSAADTGQAP